MSAAPKAEVAPPELPAHAGWAAVPAEACIVCSGKALCAGGAVLDDAMVAKMAEHPAIGPIYPVARKSFGYDAQGLYVCSDCGFVFVSPVLSDEDTTRLIFEAYGRTWTLSAAWESADIHTDPLPVWYSAVRIPSVQRSLRGHLPVGPLRVLDVGGHEGEISVNMGLPGGSSVDITQLENSAAWLDPATRPAPSVRTFNGLTGDVLRCEPDYRADLVLAINVLEHTADPNGFLQDCRRLMADDGLLLIEVPYEPEDAMALALNLNFQIVHDLYFFPPSFEAALVRNGLRVEQLEVLPHAHTGVIAAPSTQMRAVCRKAEPAPRPPDASALARSLDALIGSFGGSLAFEGGVRFVAFVYDLQCLPLLDIFRCAPNFKGVVTTNDALGYLNLSSAREIDAEYMICLKPQDREPLMQAYTGPLEII